MAYYFQIMKKNFLICLLFYFQIYFIYSHEKKFFLGATVGNTPKTIQQQINYLDITGAIILKLTDRGPAQISGLLVGDIILKIDEREINSFYDVIKYISGYNGKGDVLIKVFRNNHVFDYKIKLAEKS